jgi:hypothetical protein
MRIRNRAAAANDAEIRRYIASRAARDACRAAIRDMARYHAAIGPDARMQSRAACANSAAACAAVSRAWRKELGNDQLMALKNAAADASRIAKKG